MSYKVQILQEAENDIFDIYLYILRNDSSASADYVFENIEKICFSLESKPSRGHVPPELANARVAQYREVYFKPYRIIYEVEKKEVFIHCVLDGRRDLQQLLELRLLR